MHTATTHLLTYYHSESGYKYCTYKPKNKHLFYNRIGDAVASSNLKYRIKESPLFSMGESSKFQKSWTRESQILNHPVGLHNIDNFKL